MQLDFAIIGSGVSGGRIAHELVSQGALCALIEAGKHLNRKSFPGNEMDYSSQMFWGGGLEISTDGRLGFLRAKCVGGTSVVNQALVDRFDEAAFGDWRARSGVSFLNELALEPHYKAVESKMRIGSIPPEHFNKNAATFSKALNLLGYHWSPLKRAQGDCLLEKGSDCIVCLGGCPRDSKQSSLVTCVEPALKKGLSLDAEFQVKEIVPLPDRVRIRGVRRGTAIEMTARKVVLACGALGNTEILLRSGLGEKLPALGKRFSCHPQFMTYAYFEEPIDAHKGALQSVKSDDPRFRRSGYKFENVYVPPIGTAMLIPGFGHKHHRAMRKYRHLASVEVCVRDEPMGEIFLDSAQRLKVKKPLTLQDRARIREGTALIDELFEIAGAKEIIRGNQGFGLHLMGGCVIGTDPLHSVVNPDFEVHGFPSLLCADSSIFPSAPGINPSLTIMALSQMASEKMLKAAR